MTATWILVCDASHARLFEEQDLGSKRWNLVQEFDYPKGRAKGRELLDDSMEAKIGSHHKVEALRFAQTLAKVLEQSTDRFRWLIVVSPPEFLGMIRSCLSEPVRKKILDTVDKDLVQLNERDLVERVGV